MSIADTLSAARHDVRDALLDAGFREHDVVEAIRSKRSERATKLAFDEYVRRLQVVDASMRRLADLESAVYDLSVRAPLAERDRILADVRRSRSARPRIGDDPVEKARTALSIVPRTPETIPTPPPSGRVGRGKR